MQTQNIPVDFYFSPDPEDIEDDMIVDFPGNYDEEDSAGKCFFETSYDVVRTHFVRAFLNLSPVFEDRKFTSLNVCIDLAGICNATAAYWYGYTDVMVGEYHFSVGRNVLKAFLKNYWDSSFSLNPFYMYIWEHELIHMLDHKYCSFQFSADSIDFREFWMHYLLSFRAEGIAGLYELMKGHNPVKEMNSARDNFKSDLLMFAKPGAFDTGNTLPLRKNIIDSSIYCSVGQWMVMHVLYCIGDSNLSALIQKVYSQIKKGEVVNECDILFILKHSFALDPETFIKSLTMPGLDGKEFVAPFYFNHISRFLNKFIYPSHFTESANNIAGNNSVLNSLFYKLWPAVSC